MHAYMWMDIIINDDDELIEQLRSIIALYTTCCCEALGIIELSHFVDGTIKR
jgi:hypothetical protein